MKPLTIQSFQAYRTSFLSWVQIFSSAPCSHKPSIYVFPLVLETKFHTHTKSLYFREETGGKETLNRTVADILRILSALNLFVNAILVRYCCPQVFESCAFSKD
jgi:uncharacterized membrane protein